MHSNGLKPEMGNLKYEDVNNDGKLDYQDKQVLGNTIPKITYGLTAGLRYKGFDLNILFQGLGQANAFTKSGMTRMQYEWLTISDKWRDAWSQRIRTQIYRCFGLTLHGTRMTPHFGTSYRFLEIEELTIRLCVP